MARASSVACSTAFLAVGEPSVPTTILFMLATSVLVHRHSATHREPSLGPNTHKGCVLARMPRRSFPARSNQDDIGRTAMRHKGRHAEYLATVPLFRACSAKQLARVAQLTEELDIPEGEVLAHEGR